MLKRKENINLNTTCQNNPTKFPRNFTLGEKRIRKKCLDYCDNFAPRSCKTCHLVKVEILNQAKSQLPKLVAEVAKITQIRQQLEKSLG